MKNKIVLIVLVASIIFSQNICYCFDESKLAEAETSFLKGDFENAASGYEKLLDEKIKSEVKNDIRYKLALCYIKLGRIDDAKNTLTNLLSKDLKGDFGAEVRMAYADAFYASEGFNEAYLEYEKTLSYNPNTNISSTVNYKLGEVSRKLGDWEKAKMFYKKVITDYPQSFEANLSQGVLKNGEFYFSVQVGSFAKPENAQNMVDELKAKGYDAYTAEYETEGLQFYRVRVGKCDKKDQAFELESRLKAEGLPARIFP